MKKEFIPYEQVLSLKDLEFDEPCFGFYKEFGDKWLMMMPTQLTQYEQNNLISCIKNNSLVEAPTFSQAFRWFREKYDCHHTIQHNKKYVGIAYSSVVNFSIDEFNTYEEAELECLKKLIEIVKEM